MRILKILRENITQILIAVLVVYTYYRFGPYYTVVSILILAVSRSLPKNSQEQKPRYIPTKEFILTIDEDKSTSNKPVEYGRGFISIWARKRFIREIDESGEYYKK